MRKVFESNVSSQIMLVRDALERSAIEASVQNFNESLSPVPGFAPPAEIWAMHDDDYERAQQVVVATMAALTDTAEQPPWTCRRCGETNPATFETCWKCRADRPATSGHD